MCVMVSRVDAVVGGKEEMTVLMTAYEVLSSRDDVQRSDHEVDHRRTSSCS